MELGTTTPARLFAVSTGGAKTDTNTKYVQNLVQSNESSNQAALGLYFKGASSAADRIFQLQPVELGVANDGLIEVNPDGGKFRANRGILFGTDTSAANALDDYEEGTWSPVFNVASGSVTMHSSRDVGRYTKIGRVVQIQGQFSTGTASSPSGVFTISGLPFANGSDTDLSEEVLFFIGANNIVNNSGKPLIGYIGASSSTMIVYNQDGNNLGDAGNVLQSNAYLGFTATYTI